MMFSEAAAIGTCLQRVLRQPDSEGIPCRLHASFTQNAPFALRGISEKMNECPRQITWYLANDGFVSDEKFRRKRVRCQMPAIAFRRCFEVPCRQRKLPSLVEEKEVEILASTSVTHSFLPPSAVIAGFLFLIAWFRSPSHQSSSSSCGLL